MFSITSGIVNYDGSSGANAHVRVGDYWYIHLKDDRFPEGESVLGIRDTVNAPPTQIGDVRSYPTGDHLHFQLGPPGGAYENPFSWGNGPENYFDIGDPIVYSLDFWRSGSETQNPE